MSYVVQCRPLCDKLEMTIISWSAVVGAFSCPFRQ